ncbi:MAG: ribonuclease R, partial [Betaproteobacteria bacterium]|nr:ribonuclease R [Betaproteobacteria bacterium]
MQFSTHRIFINHLIERLIISSRRKKRLRDQDPYLTREKIRYDTPLPSREFILELLEQEGVPVRPSELEAMLDIESGEQMHFARRLQAMERDGQIMRNRAGALCMVEKLGFIHGRVEGHRDGFGFVVPDDGGDDLFLSPWEMGKVLHGDQVVVREVSGRQGKREAVIVEVGMRANSLVVGRLHHERGIHFVVPEDRRINQDLLIPADGIGTAKPDEVVVAEIIQQPEPHVKPLARIVEVVGHATDPGIEIEIALRKHSLPHEFPEVVKQLCKKFSATLNRRDLAKREDLRDLPLVTIDGEHARDFDDAVYCEPQGKGFRLIVAIADVSHYVKHGDALDQSARDRATSVYFPRRVIPMLPEVLSNGLCSLNPDEDRLCLACEMTVSNKGRVEQFRFFNAVMRSHARLTYTTVAQRLAQDVEAPLQKQLRHLRAVFEVLLAGRAKRGAIDLDTSEIEIEFDDKGRIRAIHPLERNVAHRLIEECMLAANTCAAEFLEQAEHPLLFRVHEGPTEEKLEDLRGVLAEFGIDLPGGKKPKPKDYAKALDKLRSKPQSVFLQTVLLRSLKQARYTPENAGHFGLAYERYTHFTSPIRRYPDLLVHRAIKAVLAESRYAPGDWRALGTHCSERERRAADAEREVVNWLKCFYMQDRVGETF